MGEEMEESNTYIFGVKRPQDLTILGVGSRVI